MKRQYRVFFARCQLGQSRNRIRTIGSELEQRPLFLLIGIGLLLLLLLLLLLGDLLERLRDRYTPEQNGG
jgi:predicted lysophospholipase L1 biosynthesis ABC-type transport system permease subunit